MIDENKELKSRFKSRSGALPEQTGNWSGSKDSKKSYDFFGLDQSNRFVRRFKLLFRDGRTVSIPYAYLPIVLYNPSDGLIIKTGDIEVTISGRSLEKLADWLSEEKVLWIKESASGVDDGDSEVFVSSITIDGELLG